MKILFLSDLHKEGIPEEYKSKLNTYDLIVSLGDNTYEDLLPLKDVSVHKIGVHGNHYITEENDKFKLEDLGIHNIHMEKISINGYSFFGFQGDIKYVFSELLKKSEGLDKAREELKALAKHQDSNIDFFITHLPALGILDDPNDTIHRGLPAINSFIEKNKPRHHLFGHMHQCANIINGKTQTYCVYKALEVLI